MSISGCFRSGRLEPGTRRAGSELFLLFIFTETKNLDGMHRVIVTVISYTAILRNNILHQQSHEHTEFAT